MYLRKYKQSQKVMVKNKAFTEIKTIKQLN